MLRIIGVAHRAQSRAPGVEETAAQRVFTHCLNQTLQTFHPTFVAEEDSQEALDERRQISIAKDICDAMAVAHRLCDPNRVERRAFNYRDGQELELEMFMHDDEGLSNDEIHLKARAIELGRYFPIRERFWLKGLVGCREQDAVFICGNAHIETFTSLLDREGVPYRIVERGIGVTREEAEDFHRIEEYLGAHPELRNE
jgi:hypothetical protein